MTQSGSWRGVEAGPPSREAAWPLGPCPAFPGLTSPARVTKLRAHGLVLWPDGRDACAARVVQRRTVPGAGAGASIRRGVGDGRAAAHARVQQPCADRGVRTEI